ncbi:MAG: M23 family metallopeptidase [Gemmatimonadales bacterium]
MALFVGSFLIGLIYSTKSESGPMVTIARSGDTALVVDKTKPDSSPVSLKPDQGADGVDSLTAPDPTAATIGLGPKTDTPAGSGSAAPPVVPSDLTALQGLGMIIPVAGVQPKNLIDSFDDMRGGTRRHNALDIMAQRNTPVLAATSGKVLKMHNSVAGGLSIYESDPTLRFVMMYGHLNSYRPGLKEGADVKRGEIIGFVGSTGNANPAAPHLHFQITRNDNVKEWWKGTPLNPFPVLHPK